MYSFVRHEKTSQLQTRRKKILNNIGDELQYVQLRPRFREGRFTIADMSHLSLHGNSALNTETRNKCHISHIIGYVRNGDSVWYPEKVREKSKGR